VRIGDIECLEADHNYVNVHTPQRSHLLCQMLAALDKALKTAEFLRIHRSIIVNRGMIRDAARARRAGIARVCASGARRHVRKVERVMGIEPTLVAWEATVLPLNYTRAPGQRE
jgi:DNA-binding LytR/AlgR family response regulator